MDAGRRGGRRLWRATAQVGFAAALLVVLGLRIGGAAFARGVSSLTLPVIGMAIAAIVLSTVCAAWRWRVVARELDVPLSVGRAFTAYYRSQFLNSVLPVGVAGDAHRAVRHGHDVDDAGRAARAVVWERTAGQIVQTALAIAVLAIMPSPGRRVLPVLVAVCTGALLAAVYLRRWRRSGSSWLARVASVVRTDLRDVMRRPVWPVLIVASLGVFVTHVALFVVVAHTVDPATSIRVVVPLAVLVQIATGIPLSVGGWGLREGVAGWAFAAAGPGAAAGVAVSTAYGVASLIAVLPGAVLLGMDLLRRRRSPRGSETALDTPRPRRTRRERGFVATEARP